MTEELQNPTTGELPAPATIIKRMQEEILDLVREGRVPSTVRAFDTLHDYVDANELGGFTSDEALTSLSMESRTTLLNACQNAVGQWLADGTMLRDFLAAIGEDKGSLRMVARAKAAEHAERIAAQELLMQAGQAAIYFTPDMTPEERYNMKVWLVYMGLAEWALSRTGRLL